MNLKKYKTYLLPVLLVICIIGCYFHGFPALPTNKPLEPDASSPVIISFLSQNFVPIFYFCISIVFSLFVLFLGVTLRKEIQNKHQISKTYLSLSLFILLSGIWMITDSSTLQVFSNHIPPYLIVLISFFSFMLMPLAFLDCVTQLIPRKAFSVVDTLFFINTVAFPILVILKVPTIIYFCSLAIHHILILVIMCMLIVEYINRRIHHQGAPVPFGILLFFLATILTLVLFLLNRTEFYPITLSIGLISLTLSVFKYILDDTILSYEKQIQADVYRKMAYTDALCGIKNRNAFEEAQMETASCESLCYVIFDINNLKPINDQLGHSAGDYIIQTTANLIQQHFSAIGECFRIGGDEFAVICTTATDSIIHNALEQLHHAIDSHNQRIELKISVAHGVAFRAAANQSPEELFQQADQNMYKCKALQKQQTLS